MTAGSYVVRHPRSDEAGDVQALLDAVETAAAGEPRPHPLEAAVELLDPRMHRATNAWVAEAPGGELAGFAFVFWGASAQGEAEVAVSPRHRGRGVDEALLDAVEARAEELAGAAPDGLLPRLHVSCGDADAGLRSSLVRRGFRRVRESYLMRADLPERPATAPLPAGVEVRAFTPGRDELAVYSAMEDAFADHFLFEPSTFEQWRVHTVELQDFDPSLWLVAWDAEAVAGEALTFARPNEAYVGSVSVRRAWRGRGLGLALLTRAFSLARERGLRTVRLGVDAQNPTGALALYLKAGMRVERRELLFAKDLRQEERDPRQGPRRSREEGG